MMEPTAPPKSVIEQLNSFCQSDVKTQWTAKRLRNSREVCGFSYVENDVGEWLMMPTLCPNCQHTLELAMSGEIYATNSLKSMRTKETMIGTARDTTKDAARDVSQNILYPSPLTPQQSDGTRATYQYATAHDESRDYLLYPIQSDSRNQGLEFYRPSLASSGCCQIL